MEASNLKARLKIFLLLLKGSHSCKNINKAKGQSSQKELMLKILEK